MCASWLFAFDNDVIAIDNYTLCTIPDVKQIIDTRPESIDDPTR